MANFKLDTTTLDKLMHLFRPETIQRILAFTAKRTGAAAESVVPPYPKASGKALTKFYTRDTVAGKKVSPFKSKFKTQGQAFKVLKLGEAGKIPYRRSGQLGKSIVSKTIEITSSHALIATGTSLIGARQVIGDDGEQSMYHRDTWWQLHRVLSDNAPKVQAESQKALNQAVSLAVFRKI